MGKHEIGYEEKTIRSRVPLQQTVRRIIEHRKYTAQKL